MRQIQNKDETGTSTSADTKSKKILPSLTAGSASKENGKEIQKLVSFWDNNDRIRSAKRNGQPKHTKRN